MAEPGVQAVGALPIAVIALAALRPGGDDSVAWWAWLGVIALVAALPAC